MQIATMQNCVSNENFANQKIKSFCTYILWEANMIEKFNLIALLNDEFLEQSKY